MASNRKKVMLPHNMGKEGVDKLRARDDIALFPLTIPITTGPGTISVAVTLGAGHPPLFAGLGWFFLGMTAAALAMTVVIWFTYHYADRLATLRERWPRINTVRNRIPETSKMKPPIADIDTENACGEIAGLA